MIIKHRNKQYEMTFGSDVINDGMYLELRENYSDVLLFAFWSDADSEFTFSAYQSDLPFDLVELFIQEARRRLPPVLPPQEVDALMDEDIDTSEIPPLTDADFARSEWRFPASASANSDTKA